MKTLWCVLLLGGCGTQYSDPIRVVPSEGGAVADPRVCSGEIVQDFSGENFATMMRLVQDDLTIEAWIKTAVSLTGTGAYVGNPIVFADVPSVITDDFGAGLLNDKFQMTIGNPDTPVKSTSDVTTDMWVHVAGTRKRASGLVLVFVNGVLEGAGTGNTNALSASPTMSIGGRAERDFFIGQMSELRIWSTARSQAEILENMHRRLVGNEAGLVGYYPLDDSAGSSVHDASPSQNHAKLAAQNEPAAAAPPVCGQ
jgi:hypothetical protein